MPLQVIEAWGPTERDGLTAGGTLACRVLAYTMTVGDKRISASLASFELAPSGSGTRLMFTEQGAYFEGADGEQVREQGWQALLQSLDVELQNPA